MRKYTAKMMALSTFCGLLAAPAFAGVDLTPIIGYERVQKLVPDPHSTDRLTYGARLTLGVPLLAIEAEYTQGRDTETFTSQDLVITDTAQKARVGLRSGLGGSLLRIIGRGGVQAKQNHHVEAVGGTTTVDKHEPVSYKPYAGAGLRMGLSARMSVSVEVVAVFNKWPDMKKNDYETTAGLNIRIP
ncbi:MAG: hypothetical protein JST16_16920 [Bdellovibrionales bacterium]|nr:hypothetical protein [Bdellovibrionales bacterium]